jgi:hypothetical protein
MTAGMDHIERARPGHGPGRAFLFLFVLPLVLTDCRPGWAHPSESILDVLQWGTRPAPGLGGDPFLSPSLRQTGWWHQGLLDDAPDIQLRHEQYLPITRRLSGGDGELESACTRLGGRYSLKRWGRRLGLGLSLTSIDASANLEGDLASLDFGENGASAGALARLERLAPGLDLQVGAPLGESSSRHSGDGLVCGFHYVLENRLHLLSRWSRWETQEPVFARLDDETVISPLNLQVDTFQHEGRLDLWINLAVEVRISESNYHPRYGLADVDHEFLPQAWSISRQQSLEWGTAGGLRLLVRHSDAQLNAGGGAYWEGQRYLRLSHTKARLESYLAAIQLSPGPGRRVFADVEFGDLEAFVRVDLDSWRFASWEQAWLGAKKIVQIDGQGRWERYHLACEGPWRAWSLGGGLSYYEIRPAAYSESWIHIPLTSPRDYERVDLATTRLSLGAVSLQAGRRVGRLLFSAEWHQFVYGNDHRDDSSDPEPPTPPNPEPSSRPSGWVGGTYATFSVGYFF